MGLPDTQQYPPSQNPFGQQQGEGYNHQPYPSSLPVFKSPPPPFAKIFKILTIIVMCLIAAMEVVPIILLLDLSFFFLFFLVPIVIVVSLGIASIWLNKVVAFINIFASAFGLFWFLGFSYYLLVAGGVQYDESHEFGNELFACAAFMLVAGALDLLVLVLQCVFLFKTFRWESRQYALYLSSAGLFSL